MSTPDTMTNAVGYVITLTVTDDGAAVDLSTASTKQFLMMKPDGTKLIVSADFSSDGTDGKLKYATIAGDIDQAGRYRVQAYVVTPTFSGSSTITDFTAGRNL